MRTLYSALALSLLLAGGCDSASDGGAGPGSSRADSNGQLTVMLHQKHAMDIQIDCVQEQDCDVQLKLAPNPAEDTLLLFGKRLSGKTAADYPLTVVTEHYSGAGDYADGSIQIVVADAGQDAPGPMVGELDDGTPVYYTGGAMHFVQAAKSQQTVTLLLNVGFYYTDVSFVVSAACDGAPDCVQLSTNDPM